MIEANNLCKIYCAHQRGSSFSAALWRRKYQTVTALNHVNLHIANGERVGIFDSNGADKTTLVKLLSRLRIIASQRWPVNSRRLHALPP